MSVYGIRYLTTGNVTQQNYIKYGQLSMLTKCGSMIILMMLTMLTRYVEHDTLIWDYLNSSIHLAPYLEKKFERIYAGDAYRFYRQRWV